MKTAALSRNPANATVTASASADALVRAAMGFVAAAGAMLAAWVRTDRDRRMLEALPAHVLADMGLDRVELPYGADGDRHVWVGRARHI